MEGHQDHQSTLKINTYFIYIANQNPVKNLLIHNSLNTSLKDLKSICKCFPHQDGLILTTLRQYSSSSWGTKHSANLPRPSLPSFSCCHFALRIINTPHSDVFNSTMYRPQTFRVQVILRLNRTLLVGRELFESIQAETDFRAFSLLIHLKKLILVMIVYGIVSNGRIIFSLFFHCNVRGDTGTVTQRRARHRNQLYRLCIALHRRRNTKLDDIFSKYTLSTTTLNDGL